MVKNGSQQRTKHPTIIPIVFAAFVSIRNLRTWVLMFLFVNEVVLSAFCIEGSSLRLGVGEGGKLTELPLFLRSLLYNLLILPSPACFPALKLPPFEPSILFSLALKVLAIWVPCSVKYLRCPPC